MVSSPKPGELNRQVAFTQLLSNLRRLTVSLQELIDRVDNVLISVAPRVVSLRLAFLVAQLRSFCRNVLHWLYNLDSKENGEEQEYQVKQQNHATVWPVLLQRRFNKSCVGKYRSSPAPLSLSGFKESFMAEQGWLPS